MGQGWLSVFKGVDLQVEKGRSIGLARRLAANSAVGLNEFRSIADLAEHSFIGDGGGLPRK
jgi:hypothetical protein